MSDIKICSYNCRGLGQFQKRRDVLNYLRRTNFQIFLLQDIHCHPSNTNRFRNLWGTDVLIAGYSNIARGVAILTKSIDIAFSDCHFDQGGNYIIVKATINNSFTLIIANIYGPNVDDPEFFQQVGKICNEIRGSSNVPIILAGDFNVSISQSLDTENYARSNNPRNREELIRLMSDLSVLDIFRERNPETRKFTWKVGCPPRKQARLDYFLVSDNIEPVITETNILPPYRSDHAMVTIQLQISTGARGKGYYKFNASLLRDDLFIEKIKHCISKTLSIYALPVYTPSFVAENPESVDINISWKAFWDTLILSLRTEAISYSIFKNRERNKDENYLVKKISELHIIDQLSAEQHRELEKVGLEGFFSPLAS